MIKYLRFGLMFPVLLITLVTLVLGGPWMWTGFLLSLAFMVAGDELLPQDERLLVYERTEWLDALLFCTLPFLALVFLVLVWMVAPDGDPLGLASVVRRWTDWDMQVARERTSWLDIAGGMLSVMLMTGIGGITVAHELMHRNHGAMRAMARLLEVFSFDVPSHTAHIQGHHVLVGLPSDPSTSFRGESAYAFVARAVVTGNMFSWQTEAARLRRLGMRAFNWRNRFLQGHAMSTAMTAAAWWLSGWRGAAAFVGTALLAKCLLELINYIQHYGLVRVEGTPIAMHHSWNSNKCISSYMLCNATRHSSHHMDPQRPFWLTDPLQEAPAMPYGYLTSVLIALVPPLWHRLMAPRLLHWDARYASPDECSLAAGQNRCSGIAPLMASAAAMHATPLERLQ